MLVWAMNYDENYQPRLVVESSIHINKSIGRTPNFHEAKDQFQKSLSIINVDK